MGVLSRHNLTEFGYGSVSTKEMKMGQPDFSGKEIAHDPAGH
jgi:hypothetical protein